MFHYSAYWKTWDRVLSVSHPEGPFVEVNLTPINPETDRAWEDQVAGIKIRAHGTSRAFGDRVVPFLPCEVQNLMREKLGKDLTQVLLTVDFLPMIDWNKYHRRVGGGLNLSYLHK